MRQSRRVLSRSAAILVVGGLAAGCSSGVSRFSDDIFTGSTSNQRSIIKDENQPYPGDAAALPAPSNGAYANSPASSAVQPAPVSRSSLPPVASNAAPVQPQTVASAPALDSRPTNSTVSAAPAQPSMSSQAGGAQQVTVREGETLSGISRRSGVPVSVIMRANDIADANSVRVGQKIVIPSYAYSDRVPASAPESRKVAAASSGGERQPTPTPQPLKTPDNQVAVLPQQPKLKEPEARAEGAAPAAPATGEAGVYTVASGDSLYAIARKTGVKVDAIKAANGLDGGNIRVGQKLRIPAAGAATTVAAAPEPKAAAKVDPVVTGTPGSAQEKPKSNGATLAAYTPPNKTERPIDAVTASNDAEAPDSTGIGKMRWPVRGRVIGTYGNGRNDGIDIAVPEGTPIKAAENGVVIYAGDGLKDFGQTVLLRHADGKVTVYGHTSEIKVSRGDNVRRGQEIARSGMSGNADTPKLHFEVRKDSEPVDPQQFLE